MVELIFQHEDDTEDCALCLYTVLLSLDEFPLQLCLTEGIYYLAQILSVLIEEADESWNLKGLI